MPQEIRGSGFERFVEDVTGFRQLQS